MDGLRFVPEFSLRTLELALFSAVAKQYAEAFRLALEQLDEEVAKQRDRGRYRLKGCEERELQTMFGVSVRFRRRRYYDTVAKRWVYLLDETMQLPAHKQVSPALEQWMLSEAVWSSSYRSAANGLKALYGHAVVSHESVRRMVLETGRALEQGKAEELQRAEGTRKIKLLFMEVDGLVVSLQRAKKHRLVEEKVLTVHEGWRRRHGASREYALVSKRHFRTQEKAFWEAASRFVYSIYDIDAETVVVINGDRAPWIREGMKYFPRALYQVDTFHLKRELREIFGHDAKVLAELDEARGSDATGETFLSKLAQAVKELNEAAKRRRGEALLRDLADIPEAVVDYRRRLEAMGMATDGLRGLGAAESQIDTFSDRVKQRGRSWSREGLAAMMELLCWRNTDTLHQVMDQIEALLTRAGVSLESIKEKTVRRVREVIREGLSVHQAGAPITRAGRTASGGMSWWLNRIISGTT